VASGVCAVADELDSSLCGGEWPDCARGVLLPAVYAAGTAAAGEKIVPERIRDNRQPYYEALRAADRAWDDGHFDVSQLAAYLSDLLKAQLADAP